jgi:hypothetical protein
MIGAADFQCGRFDRWAEPWPYVDPPYITMAYLNAINQGNRALRSGNYPRMLQAYNELMDVVIPAGCHQAPSPGGHAMSASLKKENTRLRAVNAELLSACEHWAAQASLFEGQLGSVRAVNADLLATLEQARHAGKAAGIPKYMLEQISAAIAKGEQS